VERITFAARERLPVAIAEFDVGGLVRKKVSDYPIEKLEELVLSVAQQHLKTIELFGAIIGFFIGVAQAIYFWFTYHPRRNNSELRFRRNGNVLRKLRHAARPGVELL
jgi:hypothetical protein